jgi:carbonic anhydrase/acetyltransferase-like protein (isoleucine patch superfamily)
VPGKVRSELTDDEVAAIEHNAAQYRELRLEHAAAD